MIEHTSRRTRFQPRQPLPLGRQLSRCRPLALEILDGALVDPARHIALPGRAAALRM